MHWTVQAGRYQRRRAACQYTEHEADAPGWAAILSPVKNERPHLLNTRVRYWSVVYLERSAMSVKAVAEAAGISRTTAHRVFYGKDDDELLVGTVEAVALALGVDVEALFCAKPGEPGTAAPSAASEEGHEEA